MILFFLLNGNVEIFKRVHLIVETLCRRYSNLLTVDATLNFILKELSEKKSIFGYKMTDAIKQCFQERRRIELSGIINYLPNAKQEYQSKGNSLIRNRFSLPRKTVIRKNIRVIIQRLNNTQEEDIKKILKYHTK